nr:MAG TPA: hypothetical protein [Caudoviricetes sp.]
MIYNGVRDNTLIKHNAVEKSHNKIRKLKTEKSK